MRCHSRTECKEAVAFVMGAASHPLLDGSLWGSHCQALRQPRGEAMWVGLKVAPPSMSLEMTAAQPVTG